MLRSLVCWFWLSCCAGLAAQEFAPYEVVDEEFTTSVMVRGAVTANGAALPDARVTLFSPDLSYFRETRSLPNGQFLLNGIRPGKWRLGVAARDFDYEQLTVRVANSTLVRDFRLEPESEPGRWDVIGSTAPEFLDATDIGVLLADGRIFYCHDTIDPILFNPPTGQSVFPPGSGLAGGCMNGSLLAGGRVLFAGGQEGDEPGNFRLAIRWVRTFNPLSGQWIRLSDLRHLSGRWYPGLARLNDGSLLAMGGGTRPNAARTNTCERFNLATQAWSFTGPMLNPTEFPPSALLHTGEVLATWYPPQLFNPVSGQWRATGNFVQPERGWPGHSDHSLVVLADGRALAVGISGPANDFMGEIYDPASQTWTVTSNPALRRFQTEVVQLPDGRVLAAGGEAQSPNPPVANILNVTRMCDLYNPETDEWRRIADMNWIREYHAVTLLAPDGRVLTTGGTRIKFQVGPLSADIEAYSPPYLFRGVRPRISAISGSTFGRGDSLTLSVFPRTRLTSVELMGVQSTTHWVDGGIPRRIALAVEQSEGIATMTLPSDPNILPLGYYMVFAMVDDIPSEARIVEIR